VIQTRPSIPIKQPHKLYWGHFMLSATLNRFVSDNKSWGHVAILLEPRYCRKGAFTETPRPRVSLTSLVIVNTYFLLRSRKMSSWVRNYRAIPTVDPDVKCESSLNTKPCPPSNYGFFYRWVRSSCLFGPNRFESTNVLYARTLGFLVDSRDGISEYLVLVTLRGFWWLRRTRGSQL